MARFRPGAIVVVDWRSGGLPREPNKRRPAVVVEESALFDPDYPNVIVVPLTSDARLAIPGLSTAIEPTPENGCAQRCFALAPSVTSVSVQRVQATASFISAEHLADIRRRIAESIGLA